LKIEDIEPVSINLEGYNTTAFVSKKTLKIGIVVATFNKAITSRLLKGALHYFREHPIQDKNITVIFVPGAFELPVRAQQLLKSGLDSVICLGCVIRGDTAHFDFVAGECARGIMTASLNENKPIIFGVLTTDTVDQALDRCQEDTNNKGYEAAESACQLLNS